MFSKIRRRLELLEIDVRGLSWLRQNQQREIDDIKEALELHCGSTIEIMLAGKKLDALVRDHTLKSGQELGSS